MFKAFILNFQFLWFEKEKWCNILKVIVKIDAMYLSLLPSPRVCQVQTQTEIFKDFQNSNFHYHIWIQHEMHSNEWKQT